MRHSIKTASEHYYVCERQGSIREFFHGESCQSSPKHKWSVGEIATLQEMYGHLMTQREVRMADINTHLGELNMDVSAKQVYDKVRTMLRYTPNKERGCSNSNK